MLTYHVNFDSPNNTFSTILIFTYPLALSCSPLGFPSLKTPHYTITINSCLFMSNSGKPGHVYLSG